MNNVCKVVVATVAFGLGINKPDIRGTIFVNMPSSCEALTQQMGRAGRDGHPAICKVLLDFEDIVHQVALSRSDALCKTQMELLVQEILNGSYINDRKEENRYIVLDIDKIQRQMDITEEVFHTILAQLTNGDDNLLKITEKNFAKARVSFNRKSTGLSKGPLADLYEVGDLSSIDGSCFIEISLRSLQEKWNLQSLQETSYELFRLSEKGAALTIELKNNSFHLLKGTTFSVNLLKSRFNEIDCELSRRQKLSIWKINCVYDFLLAASSTSQSELDYAQRNSNNTNLHMKLRSYYDNNHVTNKCSTRITQDSLQHSEELENIKKDVRILSLDPRLNPNTDNSEQEYSPCVLLKFKEGRTFIISRILTGIGSKLFPTCIYGSTPFWGRYQYLSFDVLHNIIQENCF